MKRWAIVLTTSTPVILIITILLVKALENNNKCGNATLLDNCSGPAIILIFYVLAPLFFVGLVLWLILLFRKISSNK